MLKIIEAAVLADLEMARGRMEILGSAEASEELSDLTAEQVQYFMRHAIKRLPKEQHAPTP